MFPASQPAGLHLRHPALRISLHRPCGTADRHPTPGRAGKLTSSKDLARKLERVKPYLSQGDHHGGITLSGGEPLLQPEFTAAVLLEARTRGLTTCIDTTGQGAKHAHWDKVLPHLDYALFCIKSPIPGAFAQRRGRAWAHEREAPGWLCQVQRHHSWPWLDILPCLQATRPLCRPSAAPSLPPQTSTSGSPSARSTRRWVL